MTSELALAFDVGGTTIKGELVDRSGAVAHAASAPTPPGREARAAVAALGRELLDRAGTRTIVGAGVVVPGIVDADAGIASYSANIGWRDLELVDHLETTWSLPVRIGNDVASGGVAEHRAAAHDGIEDLVFVPIGTGIAAAVVSGGHLLRGHRGETAEIGHLVVRPGVRCGCGGDGCLEAVASASAIVRRYTALTNRAVDGAGAVAARLGNDEAARTVWTEAVEALADALTAVSLLVSPERVVIGGGLSDAGALLLDPLRTALGERARVVTAPAVTAAVHGRRAGVVGAGLLAFDGWAVEA